MSNPVIIAITDHVPMAEKTRYEARVEELHQLLQAQHGFLSVDTVRHKRPHQIEYTVLSRWADKAAATGWRQDGAIQKKLIQIEEITGGTAQVIEAAGLGMWVDHAEGAAPGLPPAWKRVVQGIIAVYPMLMLILTASAPVIGSLPQPLQVLIVVIVLSALLTWPIMPWLDTLMRPWLMAKK